MFVLVFVFVRFCLINEANNIRHSTIIIDIDANQMGQHTEKNVLFSGFFVVVGVFAYSSLEISYWNSTKLQANGK